NAQANLFANDDVTINGNVEVTAFAKVLGSTADEAHACANLEIDALHGNLVVNHDVSAKATASLNDDSTAQANAVADLFANQDITINGNVDVTAFAKTGSDRGTSATACANLQIEA